MAELPEKSKPEKRLTHSKSERAAQARRIGRRRRKERPGKISHLAASGGAPASLSKYFRLGLWGVAAVIFIGMMLTNDTAEPRSADTIPPGTPAPLVEQPVEIPGCKQSATGQMPVVEYLEDGSEFAQKMQLEASREASLPVEIVNSVGMRFRLIPAGQYVMGSPENEAGRAVDEAEHVVPIPRHFYISAHEVTQEQWKQVMAEAVTDPSDPKQQGAKRPVQEVTWRNCNAFVNALSELEGQPKGTYRLPLEREWEYACRAGTKTTFHARSEELWRFANYLEEHAAETMPVGTLRPNAWGLYNMHGNVWEWCADNFADYESKETHELHRVIRGGNWYITKLDCRSATRYRLPPDSHGNFIGFRVVRLLTRDQLEQKTPKESKP
ncbi:MAG TPA: hypothetical protein DCR55_15225 [Lentisphaeria bacterium]|nr:hypothetical protein [Lentisphaeria bacterium]